MVYEYIYASLILSNPQRSLDGGTQLSTATFVWLRMLMESVVLIGAGPVKWTSSLSWAGGALGLAIKTARGLSVDQHPYIL